MYVRIAVVLLALVLGVGVAACGGGDDNGSADTTTTETTTDETTTETTTEETTTDETTTAAGRDVFIANCGTCHTLSDAGTSGSIGPNLDELSLSEETIENQVRQGGGGMPSFEGNLSDDEIESVAAYVASQQG